jgi:hypothetical protein
MISAICFLLFHAIGAKIDEKGLLKESFALLPLGYFFFLAGLAFFLSSAKRRFRKK